MSLFHKETVTQSFVKELNGAMVGSPIRVVRVDDLNWSIEIGEDFRLSTMMWRLIGTKSIVLTSDDDGHQFGLPEPVDAEKKANNVLFDYEVSGVEIDEGTGDLALQAGDALILQVLTTSMGYESWQIYQDGEFFGAGGNGGLR